MLGKKHQKAKGNDMSSCHPKETRSHIITLRTLFLPIFYYVIFFHIIDITLIIFKNFLTHYYTKSICTCS